MTEQEALNIAQTWILDWNQHNLDAIMAHYAEDIDFTSPFIAKLANHPSGNLQGKTALRDYFAKALEAYPDLRFEVLEILTGVDSIVIYYKSVQDRLAAESITINAQGLVTVSKAHYSAAV